MATIQVNDLSFHYPESGDEIFSHVSFSIDTNWKLGFIGRNGKGKTTFMRILLGLEGYTGRIIAPCEFDYFPFPVPDQSQTARSIAKQHIGPYQQLESAMEQALVDPELMDDYGEALTQYLALDGYTIDSLLEAETGKLGIDPLALDRPYETLSHGERTKLQLAALFLRKNAFLLIDEPTNHLDAGARVQLREYLADKKGFILISHDRELLNGATDHILSLNRATIEVQQGNYDSWKSNRDARDHYELDENTRLQGEISRLQSASRQKAGWADKVEASKIGSHAADRGAIGAKSAKMMKRAKHIQQRQDQAIDDKKSLLHDLETEEPLKLHTLPYVKKRLIYAEQLTIDYGDGQLFDPISFTLEQGDRLALRGRNGSGKSSLIKLILGQDIPHDGQLSVGTNMAISYVSQDTSHLRGSLSAYALENDVDYTLLLATLRRLDFERVQFEKDITSFSEGQKKKVLIAASLCAQAHLHIWDEPLNFIDIFSRMQIENLLLAFRPTMIFIEHDAAFTQAIATKSIDLG